MKKNNKLFKIIVLSPVIIYSLLFILLPLLYILFLSFCKSDNYGGVIYTFTMDNYITIFNSTYVKIFIKSFTIGLVVTLICTIISYPFALILRKQSKKTQDLITKLIMVPFLTNSLIRAYGWIILLRKNGIINNSLLSINAIKEPLSLMYNNFGIILGMTYTLLPFMLLPICSSVFKIDKNIIEAARDLGANKKDIFIKIILPETITGLFNGALMVFLPAIGYFFISDILGGGKIMIIGNLIKNQFLTARNWPLGSSISIFLIAITYFLIYIYKKIGGKMDDLGGL